MLWIDDLMTNILRERNLRELPTDGEHTLSASQRLCECVPVCHSLPSKCPLTNTIRCSSQTAAYPRVMLMCVYASVVTVSSVCAILGFPSTQQFFIYIDEIGLKKKRLRFPTARVCRGAKRKHTREMVWNGYIYGEATSSTNFQNGIITRRALALFYSPYTQFLLASHDRFFFSVFVLLCYWVCTTLSSMPFHSFRVFITIALWTMVLVENKKALFQFFTHVSIHRRTINFKLNCLRSKLKWEWNIKSDERTKKKWTKLTNENNRLASRAIY